MRSQGSLSWDDPEGILDLGSIPLAALEDVGAVDQVPPAGSELRAREARAHGGHGHTVDHFQEVVPMEVLPDTLQAFTGDEAGEVCLGLDRLVDERQAAPC